MAKREQKYITMTTKLVKVGNSTYLHLPQKWLDKHGLKAGDEVPLVANNILKIIPMTEIK